MFKELKNVGIASSLQLNNARVLLIMQTYLGVVEYRFLNIYELSEIEIGSVQGSHPRKTSLLHQNTVSILRSTKVAFKINQKI